MARIEVYADRLVVKLTAAERTLAMRRHDIVLDRSAVTFALLTDDPWVWVRGVRSPGTHLPRIAIGTWRSSSGRDFALIKPGRPAIVLDLQVPDHAETEKHWQGEFDPFARVILSTTHAAELITALRLDGESAVFSTER